MKDNMKNDFFILFIDDEEKSTKYFEEILRDNFEIMIATSADEGWQIIENSFNKIAVVICNQKMPDFNGVKLLTNLRYKYPNIIRILTTAYANLEDNIVAINQSNVFGFLAKPWKIEEVQKLLYDALTEYKAHLALIALAGSIAHQIRSPLSSASYAVSFVNDILENSYRKAASDELITISKKDFDEISQVLAIASSCSNRGNMIIDMILNNIKQKEIDKSKFRHISIASVIKAAIDEYAFGQNEKNRIDIKISEDFLFRGDENIMVFVLFNLLKNAIYYMAGKPESKITITTSRGMEENFLYFRDTGPGIVEDKIPSVFDGFMTSRKKEGTGLGLPFCKRAMDSFGGKIECNSKLGEYTEFVLSFPRC
jgi:signal transduction histidine kinase